MASAAARVPALPDLQHQASPRASVPWCLAREPVPGGWSQAAEGSESWGGVGEDWAGRGLQGPRLCDRWPSSYEWVSPEAGRLPEQSGVSQAADGQTPQAMAATASAGQLSSAQPQVLGAGGLRVAQKCAFSKIRSFVCSPDF